MARKQNSACASITLTSSLRTASPGPPSIKRISTTRMEGGMVERDYGRNVYESIVTKQQDPALLEWVDGSTFKMRVFPLEPRQEKRIVLSYSQRVSNLYGQLSYRF